MSRCTCTKNNIQKKIQHKKVSSYKRKQFAMWYVFLAIPIIGFFVFTLYPMLWAVIKAWFYYNGSKSAQRFVGWDNFKTLFTDKTYWNSWLVTLKFAVGKLPIELSLAMILALILNKRIKMTGFYRSVFYLPSIISVAVIGVIFANMFDYFGFINAILIKVGLSQTGIDWFSNEHTALFALITASVWNTFGINVMYFLAALKNVPEELYESAYLDGANKPRVFFQITLPLMGPVLQTILLLSLNGTLQTNDLILATTNGAPAGKTYTVMSYVVSKFIPGFAEQKVNIGYGCATALITAAILMIIALSYSKLSKKLADIY